MKRLLMLCLALSMIFLSVPIFAEIPHYMQFQGKATDLEDNPLNGDDYELTFRIYDVAFEEDPNKDSIWSETHTDVAIENGVFSVLLGGTTPLDKSFDTPYWISIQINNDEEMDRQPITSVGYAYRAEIADRAERAETATTADNSGNVVQIVHTQIGTYDGGLTVIPLDNSKPLISEGKEVMTLAITPTKATHKLLIEVIAHVWDSAGNGAVAALFETTTHATQALATAFNLDAASHDAACLKLVYYMTAPGTGTYTFRVRAGGSNFNGYSGSPKLLGTLCSSITITEIKE